MQILRTYVDEVIFCDVDQTLLSQWQKICATTSFDGGPTAHFRVGDAREVIQSIEWIDVLFYRRDSDGESGSGLFVLGDEVLPQIVNRFPVDGGLIISDGSNARGNNWRTMRRKRGLPMGGWLLKKAPEQPLLEPHGLTVIASLAANSSPAT